MHNAPRRAGERRAGSAAGEKALAAATRARAMETRIERMFTVLSADSGLVCAKKNPLKLEES